jgi:hypothetical protein
MKKVVILAILGVFFYGCYSPRDMIYYALRNENKSTYDLSGYSKEPYYSYEFGRGYKVYNKDYPELKRSYITYEFYFGTDNIYTVKLNSVVLKREKDRDTIPIHVYLKDYYYRNNYKRREDSIPINKYPFVVTDEMGIGMENKGSFYIIAESTISEQEQETKSLYISFDIEIGTERIIRENIEYKLRLIKDIRPKLW